MFLAFDIGNTHTVIGIYKNDRLIADWRFPNTPGDTVASLGKKLITLLKHDGINANHITGVGISSVVPPLTSLYSSMIKKYFHKTPLRVHAKMDLGIAIRYDNPRSLGTDRICTAIAGYKKYGGPLIILDLGTATTYDIVDAEGNFLGGIIAPGVHTSAISLHQRTAKLPRIQLSLPDNIICTNTIDGMRAGILWGTIDSVNGIVLRIQQELQKRKFKKAKVVATGGFSKFVAEHASIIQHVEPSLVLDGILEIYKRVGRKPK